MVRYGWCAILANSAQARAWPSRSLNKRRWTDDQSWKRRRVSKLSTKLGTKTVLTGPHAAWNGSFRPEGRGEKIRKAPIELGSKQPGPTQPRRRFCSIETHVASGSHPHELTEPQELSSEFYRAQEKIKTHFNSTPRTSEGGKRGSLLGAPVVSSSCLKASTGEAWGEVEFSEERGGSAAVLGNQTIVLVSLPVWGSGFT